MADRDILKATLAPTAACLNPEQLEALLDGKHSNPHLAECPRCQSELSMLKAFESTTPLREEGAAVAWISAQLDRELESIKNPGRRASPGIQRLQSQGTWMSRMFGGMRWALPATAVVVLAIAGVVISRSTKEPELQANNVGQPAVYRSQEVEIISPVGEVEQVPTELKWQSFTGTEDYKVVIMEIDRSPLWTGETKETSLTIPAAVRVKMLPGKPILWQVTALGAQAQVVGTSQIQKFVSPGSHSRN
jgi:hypothetical protein